MRAFLRLQAARAAQCLLIFAALAGAASLRGSPDAPTHPDTAWFQSAKFGIFLHWGLYSLAGNTWKGQNYYGSSEWLMNRAKIPAAEYAQLAARFDPEGFDAGEYARFVRESGARYLIITAKHHEGFAMFGSKVSPFNIVDATPYHRDPMMALSAACRAEGVQFGFYYSQFLDWHEPNGGGNKWDYPGDHDYRSYYAAKSTPQVKELLSNYGPLGVVWFDMPGGLTREETGHFMADVRRMQPNCLVSSRVGQGLGDFRDLGDSELPAKPVGGLWEALFTHNDSWGFASNDSNFKSPREILRLLASASARGGNLLLNVGPDGQGRIPEPSLRYLREVGTWLARNGDSIYGTTASPFPDQPWGYATSKPGKLYLHLFDRPADGRIVVPSLAGNVQAARWLGGQALDFASSLSDTVVTVPGALPDDKDSVVELTLSSLPASQWDTFSPRISRQYPGFSLEAAGARLSGGAHTQVLTHAWYFGNWKHDTCAVGSAEPGDKVEFPLQVLEAGDYRVTLDYACPAADAGKEAAVDVSGHTLRFETLLSGEYETHQPLLFIHHSIGVVHLDRGRTRLSVHPMRAGGEIFRLRRVVLEPAR